MDRNFGKNLEFVSAAMENEDLHKKIQGLHDLMFRSVAENKETRAKLEEIKKELEQIAGRDDLDEEQREFLSAELLRMEFELRNKKIDSSLAIAQISTTIHKVNRALTNSEAKIANIATDSYHKNKNILN